MKLDDDIRPAAGPLEFEPGMRSRRRRRARRRSRVVVIALATMLTVVGVWAGVRALDTDGTSGTSIAGSADAQTAYLFMIRKAGDLSRRSDMLVLFALDRDGRNPVALLIPSTAVTEIPGHGDDQAGRAFGFGGMPLQSIVVDNMLGIALDMDCAMTDQVFAKLVDQAGGLSIDVAAPLVREQDGVVTTEFEAGSHRMDGAAVLRYVQFQAPDETELSRLARAQQVWEALVVRWGKVGAGTLAQRFRSMGTEWEQGLETGISPLELAEFFTAFAAAGADHRVYTTLPVTPVSAGGTEQALRIEHEKVASLVSEYFAGSRPRNPYRGTRLEVVNGNGVPKVGEKVGLRLIPQGFRFVLNHNAPSFDVERTQIVVYSRDERSMGAARKIRELLGVGEIKIGARSQSLVDVTVVVGHDFQS